MSELILYDVKEGVGTLTINRPAKKNAMTYAMLGDFIEAVRHAGADDATRVVIITGAPGVFCAGTDLADLATIPGEQRGLRGSSEDRGRWWPIIECPKPVIAASASVCLCMCASTSAPSPSYTRALIRDCENGEPLAIAAARAIAVSMS